MLQTMEVKDIQPCLRCAETKCNPLNLESLESLVIEFVICKALILSRVVDDQYSPKHRDMSLSGQVNRPVAIALSYTVSMAIHMLVRAKSIWVNMPGRSLLCVRIVVLVICHPWLSWIHLAVVNLSNTFRLLSLSLIQITNDAS